MCVEFYMKMGSPWLPRLSRDILLHWANLTCFGELPQFNNNAEQVRPQHCDPPMCFVALTETDAFWCIANAWTHIPTRPILTALAVLQTNSRLTWKNSNCQNLSHWNTNRLQIWLVVFNMLYASILVSKNYTYPLSSGGVYQHSFSPSLREPELSLLGTS